VSRSCNISTVSDCPWLESPPVCQTPIYPMPQFQVWYIVEELRIMSFDGALIEIKTGICSSVQSGFYFRFHLLVSRKSALLIYYSLQNFTLIHQWTWWPGTRFTKYLTIYYKIILTLSKDRLNSIGNDLQHSKLRKQLSAVIFSVDLLYYNVTNVRD